MVRPIENTGQMRPGCLLLPLLCLLGLPGRTASGAEASAPTTPTTARVAAAPVISPSAQEIFRIRVFEDPLVPVGGEPTADENAALAGALARYGQRAGPDDFSSLTGFLAEHPATPWRASLLTCLGMEYYSTAHYSLALDAWEQAWALAKDATEPSERAVGDRAGGELAYMYARIGRMRELDQLLSSVEGRAFRGPATERISGARQGLSNMKDRPEIAFRCGPLALRQIKLAVDPAHTADPEIYRSASTQKGFALPQVAELSRKVGLNYQMAFRERGASFIQPSVVHWKVGHYAALVRREGSRYLLQDPTFQNDVWATAEALEAEGSGYFLVPAGPLPAGWRAVEAGEGLNVWGKGNVCCNDPKPNGCKDQKKPDPCSKPSCKGMAVADAHLMLVSLNIMDTPLGYVPPVGPKIDFTLTYSQREAFQPALFAYANLGSKWTFDWLAYITDNPQNPLADATCYLMGGGTRVFSGFDSKTQKYATQQLDQTVLTRTSATGYELLYPDGSKRIFAQPDGATGASRKVFLTRYIDPAGNAVSITYDSQFRVTALTDALEQVTMLSYENSSDAYKLTKVTDPFGRSATFDYDASGRLIRIVDVMGMKSEFGYEGAGDFINTLVTPYGTNSFAHGESGTTRWLETTYPDGQKDRVEFNQTIAIQREAQVPVGMRTHNDYLQYRNTFYWNKDAYATGYPDYSKATIYHWLHTADMASAAGVLESTKETLESRVWFGYAGQNDPIILGANNLPLHRGRVLDDGTTQLYTYAYNEFGRLVSQVDPVGRTYVAVYDTNGIDVVETRQEGGGTVEVLSRTTYNPQHLPLTMAGTDGQVTTLTYNSRGQLLTLTNPKDEITTYTYDDQGYLVTLDGPLPGPSDQITSTYDAFGRLRTKTDESGRTLTFEYDALDRTTKITFPDGTSEIYVYTWLDQTAVTDRAGRSTTYEYNSMQELVRSVDPLGGVTRFQWCKCGDTKSLTDAMGRSTTWRHDVQGRITSKEFPDGSSIQYVYENNTSRIRQIIDDNLQVLQFAYNADDTVKSVSYPNARVPTPTVHYIYDPKYNRILSVKDGIGTTVYTYNPITQTASLGAGSLARVDGPWPGSSTTFGYDELGRNIGTVVNGVSSWMQMDPAGRIAASTNALGSFGYSYDGGSSRLVSMSAPNGLVASRAYGPAVRDNAIEGISHRVAGTLISEFLFTNDTPAGRISRWILRSGAAPAQAFDFTYDAVDQLTGAALSSGGAALTNYTYAYDLVGNRLLERIGVVSNTAAFNILNQVTASSAAEGSPAVYEWDPEQRLISATSGTRRTEFAYDGLGRRVGIRLLENGSEVSNRRFVFVDSRLAEERDTTGNVIKRYFDQGFQIAEGPNAGLYYYTRDHLNSVRELLDAMGQVRARYAYDPFGRRTRIAGDLDADFGFGGMFWSQEANLCLTPYRAYDPSLGRWLSRDPLEEAEVEQGPNLYAYVRNNPVNLVDPSGLCIYGPWCPPPPPQPPGPPQPLGSCGEYERSQRIGGFKSPFCKDPPPKTPCDLYPEDPWCKDCEKTPDKSWCQPFCSGDNYWVYRSSCEPPKPPPKPPKPPRPPKPPKPPKPPNPPKPPKCKAGK